MHSTAPFPPPQCPAWPAVLVQRFAHVTATRPDATPALPEVLSAIRTGAWRLPVEAVRGIYQHGTEAAYTAAKSRLPALTFGGTFHPTRRNDTLVASSGVVLGDIDHCDDPPALKSPLAQSPSVAFAFVSPSGYGLKVGVRVVPVEHAAAYHHAWTVLAAHYETLTGVAWDAGASAVASLCFVSYDPDLFWNPDAVPFPVAPYTPPPPRQPSATDAPGAPALERVREALAAIPNNDADYCVWLTIGMALHASGLTAAWDLWVTWSQQSGKYDATKQQKSWDSFHQDGGVTLATLFHLATLQTAGTRRAASGQARRVVPRLYQALTTRPARRIV